MTQEDRIKSISVWGSQLHVLANEEKDSVFQKAQFKNGWFINSSSGKALYNILPWLNEDVLKTWLSKYRFPSSPKVVGIVMAGNIPLVGFHDFLCVLLSGHYAKIKLSSQDDVLIRFLADKLTAIDSQWQDCFSFDEILSGLDAIIATGSDNSSRYFEYYFQYIPKIIRKNRTSVGIIMGEEPIEELKKLGEDVFSFFGLGCRNISKVFVPEGYDPNQLVQTFRYFEEVSNHHKYANNYDYQRAIRLVSNKNFIDGGFFILENSLDLVSPIAVLFYEEYRSQDDLKSIISLNQNKLQCIVSAKGWFHGSLPFGTAQCPAVNDYADGMDTMKFLETL